MKENKFIMGAFYIALGGFIAKAIGAIYRVPLTNVIGSYGMGLYQLVFPLYSLLLTVSGTGVPSALSKLIAEKISLNDRVNADGIFKTSLALMSVIGLFLSISLLAFAPLVARVQGDKNATLLYMLISPSVFLVSIMSVFRGYFQGRMNMKPTALSQIIEQIVKLLFGLFFAYYFMPNVLKATAGAVLSVTLSEVVGTVYLLFVFIKRRDVKDKIKGERLSVKSRVKIITLQILPITLSGLLLPISQLIDSFLVVNLIKRYAENSTALYGMYSGGVNSIINMPVALCYGFSATILPLMSAHLIKGENALAREKQNTAIELTFLLAFICSALCFIFSKSIANLLFYNLSTSEINLISRLLKISSFSILFLSLMQTTSAILVAKNLGRKSMRNLFFGCVVKVLLNLILLSNENIGIYGASISGISCYFVAGTLNLLYIIKEKQSRERLIGYFVKVSLVSVFSAEIGFIFTVLMQGILGFVVGGAVAVLLFGLQVLTLKLVTLKPTYSRRKV